MAVQQSPGDLGISFDELKQVVRRRFWWFAIPSALGTLAALALALGLPPVYEAASIIAVEPQSIAPELARSSIPEETEARYNHIQLQILSRDNMSSVISEFKLFEGERALREELIERLREDIVIEPLPPAIVDPRRPVSLESFRIAFRSDRPAIVADVANRLTRDFQAAHQESRARQARSAIEFVEDELVKVRTELEKIRQEITAYKEAHQGELPEELAVNTQRLERLRTHLGRTVVNREMSRDQVRRIRIEIDELALSATSSQNDPIKRKEALEILLNRHLSLGKTEKHPDVLHARAEIAALEGLITANRAEGGPGPTSPALSALRRELRNHQVNLKVLGKERAVLDAKIASAEERIANTPRRAAELDRLGGVALSLNTAISDLQLRRVHASIGVELETDLLGEKFAVMEWAVKPDAPVSPNRPLWFLIGTILGALLGASCLILREMTDQTFHSVSELRRVSAIPVLASVPEIRLPAERAARRAQVRKVGLSSAAALLLLIGGTLAFYVYEQADDADLHPKAVRVQRGDV